MKLNTIFFILLLSIFSANASITIHTIFGSQEILEPVLCELIESPAMQRLKSIHQYGITYYLGFIKYKYSRFDHSLGVLYLVCHAGGSLKEQIAALLHDVSHTVFSHVGDYLFEHTQNSSYQDDIHTWFINQTSIADILARYGIQVKDIVHKNNGFTILEQDLPCLCADRLEYIMHGGLLEDILTLEEISEILQSLHFKQGHWFLDNQQAARKLADTAMYLTEHIFCSSDNFISYELCATLLSTALEKGIICLKDIHFGYDQEIWDFLSQHKDSDLKKCIKSMLKQKTFYEQTHDINLCNFHAHGKLRAINPLIKIDAQLVKLTDADAEYRQSLIQLNNRISHGLCIKQNHRHAMRLKTKIGRS